MLTIHVRGTAEYDDAIATLSRRGDEDLSRVEPDVRAILAAVRERGDEAVREFAERFEGRKVADVRLPDAAWRATAREAPDEVRAMLEAAAERVRRYHEHQAEPGFEYEEDGVRLGQRVRPVKAAGVYAPGARPGTRARSS